MDTIRFHDPLIIPANGEYYCFSTDTNLKGVQISKSFNLLDWSLHKTALKDSPVKKHVGDTNFWAPDVVRINGIYRLYFCASNFGTTQSVIGLAECAEIDGDYECKGEVIRTYNTGKTDIPNAIDPNFILDADGQPYLVYGSFFGGIFIAPLTNEGFFDCKGCGQLIAGGGHTAVEGAYIIYDNGWYYLFFSRGSLKYDYNIRVTRSKNITGPYTDSQGKRADDLDPIYSPGDKIAGGYNFDISAGCRGFMAPGHNSVVMLADGYYAVHHIREEGILERPEMQLRKMFFSAEGQIYLSPAPYDGTMPTEGTANDINGIMSFIRFDKFNNGVTYGRKLPLNEVEWEIVSQGGNIKISLYKKIYYGKVFIQSGALYLTAISHDGECLWGMKE